MRTALKFAQPYMSISLPLSVPSLGDWQSRESNDRLSRKAYTAIFSHFLAHFGGYVEIHFWKNAVCHIYMFKFITSRVWIAESKKTVAQGQFHSLKRLFEVLMVLENYMHSQSYMLSQWVHSIHNTKECKNKISFYTLQNFPLKKSFLST